MHTIHIQNMYTCIKANGIDLNYCFTVVDKEQRICLDSYQRKRGKKRGNGDWSYLSYINTLANRTLFENTDSSPYRGSESLFSNNVLWLGIYL